MHLYFSILLVSTTIVLCHASADVQCEDVFDQLQQLQQKMEEIEAKYELEISSLKHELDSYTAARRTALVAFSVRRTSKDDLTDSPVRFDAVVHNQGNAYNSNTGEFTAPVSGVYFFTAYAASESNQDGPLYIKHNGNIVCETVLPNDSAETGTCTAIVFLNAGDRAFVSGTNSDSAGIRANWSGFAGHIISDTL